MFFPGLDLYCADPAQLLTTAGMELDYVNDLDDDLPDLSEVWMVFRRSTTPEAPMDVTRGFILETHHDFVKLHPLSQADGDSPRITPLPSPPSSSPPR